MMANAGVLYKKKRGTKLALYCMDLWPESLTVGGIKKGSFIYKHYHKVSKRIYRKADVLMVTSKTFKQYLMKEFGVKEETIVYMPQYAEAMFSAENCKKEKSETVDLLFAGNIGAAQSMETIIHTANRTKDIENLRWHIVGDGSELENCKKLVEKFNLSTVLFYGRKPLEEMPSFYQKADAMLVTLVKGSFVSLTLPGKVQTYMAAGKPILGAIDGETAEIIAEAKCGYCGPAEDVDSLEKNVRAFYQDVKGEREKVLGENSLKYYRQNFTQEKFFEILMKELSMN